jgi:26S proteasome regulatory subunit N7
MPYSQFVLLTVISSLVSLNRVDLRDKVVKNPDVLSAIRDVPHLRELLFSLYNCQYADFFASLGKNL